MTPPDVEHHADQNRYDTTDNTRNTVDKSDCYYKDVEENPPKEITDLTTEPADDLKQTPKYINEQGHWYESVGQSHAVERDAQGSVNVYERAHVSYDCDEDRGTQNESDEEREKPVKLNKSFDTEQHERKYETVRDRDDTIETVEYENVLDDIDRMISTQGEDSDDSNDDIEFDVDDKDKRDLSGQTMGKIVITAVNDSLKVSRIKKGKKRSRVTFADLEAHENEFEDVPESDNFVTMNFDNELY